MGRYVTSGLLSQPSWLLRSCRAAWSARKSELHLPALNFFTLVVHRQCGHLEFVRSFFIRAQFVTANLQSTIDGPLVCWPPTDNSTGRGPTTPRHRHPQFLRSALRVHFDPNCCDLIGLMLVSDPPNNARARFSDGTYVIDIRQLHHFHASRTPALSGLPSAFDASLFARRLVFTSLLLCLL